MALLEGFRSAGVRAERLRTSHAFHSAQMDPVLDDMAAAVPEVSAPALALVGGVSGVAVEGAPAPGYWRSQARDPVLFGRAVRTLAELGTTVVLEVGPHAVLGPMAALAWPGEGPAVLASQRRGGGGDFAAAVAGAYEAGLDIAFEGLFAGEHRRRIALPTYPFQKKAILDLPRDEPGGSRTSVARRATGLARGRDLVRNGTLHPGSAMARRPPGIRRDGGTGCALRGAGNRSVSAGRKRPGGRVG